jgi:GH15 family glucan-1,4-alpha-glucosidase
MPREIIIGNGRLTIALDSHANIRDFYFPHVGLENHLQGHRFRTGIWTDDHFSWIGPGWEVGMEYMPETLVSRTRARHAGLEIEMEVNDAVHSRSDVYLKKASTSNQSASSRNLRFFLAEDFHVYGESISDTAMYQSTEDAVVHYKRNRYFLISGTTSQGNGIFQYSTGRKEAQGLVGTWKDAEDGRLEGNPISQGSVDSVVSFELHLEPGASETVYCWIACGRSLEEVRGLNAMVREAGVEQLLLETENYWAAWVNKKGMGLSVLPREIIKAFKTSLLILRAHMDDCGGVIASCDSDILQFNRDTYTYVWPRDGAMVALAFDLAGFQDVSRQFFKFCARTITDRGFFHHKYSPDGSVGSSWLASVNSEGQVQLPIQEDETALVLYALWKHFQRHRDIEFIKGIYQRLVVNAADFLLECIDPKTSLPRPSFDLWEEKMGLFTWTASTVYSALKGAEGFAKVFFDRERQQVLNNAALKLKAAMLSNLYDPEQRRFLRAIRPDGSKDLTIDSSTAGIFMYGPFGAEEKTVEETMDALAKNLWIRSGVGGMARYEGDEYYRVSKDLPGNPWFICTLWMARWNIARATTFEGLEKGLEIISWVAKHATPSGALAEQINPQTGAVVSVSPLAWSHAEFVIAVCEYLQKRHEIYGAISH